MAKSPLEELLTRTLAQEIQAEIDAKIMEMLREAMPKRIRTRAGRTPVTPS